MVERYEPERSNTSSLPLATPARRLVAMALDLLVVLAWMMFPGVVGLVLWLTGLRIETPAALDTLAFVTLVLPVVVTFALQEASPFQATFGKRRMGLKVADTSGAALSRSRALARSAIKFLPWQLGHTSAFQLAADGTKPLFIALALAAQAWVVISLVAMAIDPKRRALHDRIAGTYVVYEQAIIPSRKVKKEFQVVPKR